MTVNRGPSPVVAGLGVVVALVMVWSSGTRRGRRAADAIGGAAARAGLDAEAARVRIVARAAAEVARGMIAGDDVHVGTLLAVWPLAVAA